MFDAESLGIRTTGLELMRDLVHEHSGLYYNQTRLDDLADRLAPLVAERRFNSFLDYFYLLKYDATSVTEWPRARRLSVPETYFWREVSQIQAAVDVVVPQLVARYGHFPLRIWSVPCASGEEALTIAMLLEEQNWFDRANIELHAADGSPAALPGRGSVSIANGPFGRSHRRCANATSTDRKTAGASRRRCSDAYTPGTRST